MLRCMPFLILNLGGEMIYILEQRLKAQNIKEEKSRKGSFFYYSIALHLILRLHFTINFSIPN